MIIKDKKLEFIIYQNIFVQNVTCKKLYLQYIREIHRIITDPDPDISQYVTNFSR